jgi:hypothetical protein
VYNMSNITSIMITGHSVLLCPTRVPCLPGTLNRWLAGKSKFEHSAAKLREVSQVGECDTYIWVCGIDGLDSSAFIDEYLRVFDGLKAPSDIQLFIKGSNDNQFREVKTNDIPVTTRRGFC